MINNKNFRLLSIIALLLVGLASANTAIAGSSQNAAFIKKINADVIAVDHDILLDKHKLLPLEKQYHAKHHLSKADQHWLNQLAHRYKIETPDFSNPSTWKILEKRVDIVPPSLAIAQAANESAWGRSRFATQGHNLYGEWCYSAGCGIIPKRRPAGAHYSVKRFPNDLASVQSYIHNLNTNAAYKKLRNIRYQERQHHQKPQGLAMAVGLSSYASTGEVYVHSIQKMIRSHHLNQFDTLG